MKLTQLTPMLQADDLKSTIDFYTTVLDFTCDGYEPGWGWASLHKDEVAIMLALPNQHLPYHSSFLTGSIYLRTDDAEGWWNKLKKIKQKSFTRSKALNMVCGSLLSGIAMVISSSLARRSMNELFSPLFLPGGFR